METVLLVLDDSGAKGYHNNREQSKGEFGVMAGFALLESKAETFVNGLSGVVPSFPTDGKLHITDLMPAAQEALRQSLFRYLSECRARWFYEAIYVEGFHEAHSQVERLVEEAKGARRSGVKLSLNPTKESLHGELFLGAFGSGLALTMECIGSPVHLKVLMDRVDAPVLKLFKDQAERILTVGRPNRTEVTGFDAKERRVVKGAIEMRVVSGHEVLGDCSGITCDVQCSDSPLTIVADVLANSVHHHLKEIQSSTPGASLNSTEAIRGHPLQHLVYGAHLGEDPVRIADTIYRHPRPREGPGAVDG